MNAASGALVSVASQDDQLRVIDPATAATVSSVTITLSGFTVNGGLGLAVEPATGILWALLKTNPPAPPEGGRATARRLATIDPTTGVATSVGSTGDAFAGLAFDASGTLYGITGDGADVPETLFIISTADASTTSVLTLGDGDDGETIAFNRDDGLMYHASGHFGDFDPVSLNGVVFQSIDLNTLVVTNIPIAGSALTDEEAQALVYWPEQGIFLWKQDHGANAPLFRVTPGGVPTLIGDMDHQAKGLAFLLGGTNDCNANGVLDVCDISSGASQDCQPNNIPDECELGSGGGNDCDQNGVPDECDPDTNQNGIPDACDECLIDADCDDTDPCTSDACLAGVCVFTDTTPAVSASNSGPVCDGDDVQLSGGAPGMASYDWTGPGGFTSTQQNPLVSPAVAGDYILTVTDSAGCSAMATTTVLSNTPDCTIVTPPAVPGNSTGNVASAPNAPPGAPVLNWSVTGDGLLTGGQGTTSITYDAFFGPGQISISFYVVANGCDNTCFTTVDVFADCNRNGVPDDLDISGGASNDINTNSVPDECETTIYWTNGAGNIQSALADLTPGVVGIASGEGLPVEIDVDQTNRKLFWINANPPAIRTADLDGSGAATVPVPGATLSVPGGIATTDLPGPGTMFWTNYRESPGDEFIVSTAGLGGANAADIVFQNASTQVGTDGIIGGIDVAPSLSTPKIFWVHNINDNNDARVASATLSGGQASDIRMFDQAAAPSTGLAVFDNGPTGTRIFYTVSVNSGQFQIRSIDEFGGNEQILNLSPTPFSIGQIAIDHENLKVYWTDPLLNRIMRADFDGSNMQIFASGVTDPRGIAVLQSSQ